MNHRAARVLGARSHANPHAPVLCALDHVVIRQVQLVVFAVPVGGRKKISAHSERGAASLGPGENTVGFGDRDVF